jgi:hypothetical protein
VRKTFFVFGFGLLPLLVASVLVYLGSFDYHFSTEYWAVAPWYIIATIPVSLVAFFIAFTTLVIFENVSGDHSRKRKIALACFVLLVFAAAGMAYVYWENREEHKQDLKDEQFLAQEFVRNNPVVIQAAGDKFSVFPAVTVGSVPIRYEFSVRSDATVFAIVDVSRETGNPVFTLACITPISIGYRDSSKDPCAQWTKQ